MKRVVTGLFGAVGILFLTCVGVWAQATSTAQISGTVRDQSGAVLPGTEIQLTQTATGAVRNAVSGEDGAYVITNLPIGPYMLEVALPGFRTYVQTGIVLQVNSSPTINAVLEIGQVSETVEVQADAAMVETRSTGVGTVIDNSRILELPLNGRQVTQLIFLAGMASPSVGGISTGINSTRNYPTVMIALAGGAGDGVTYLLDGANHNDPHNSLNYPLPFPDALQEFKVEASALPAQYGYHSNAAISAVTKSGTNQFHGNLFEFVRNGVFNARNFFAATRDTLKRNQFGGTIGGPIMRDKLFFFGAYQGTLERSDPPTTIAYVPTPAMLAGDFTTMASPACNGGRQLTLAASQGFANNQISPSRFDPVALRLSSLLPTTSDPCGKVTYGLKSNSNENLFLGRMDYQRTQKDSIFGRIWIANLVRRSTYDGKNPLTINNSQSNFRITSFVLGNTRLLSASTVSSFRTSFSRGMVEKPLDQFYSWSDLGARNVSPLLGKTMAITVSGTGFAFGGGNALLNKGPSQNFNVAEDINVLKGTHQIAFGATYIHARYFQNGPQTAPGQMGFNGSVSGMPLADFLLGNASSWNQGDVSWQYTNQHYLGVFLQDTWKANGRFTVSYGVRWEPYMAPYDSNRRFSHFDSALFDQNVKSTVYVNAPAGRIFTGDPQYKVGNAPHNSRYQMFLPRVGVAWDPQGDGRTAVRAAYGIFTYRKEMHSYVNFTIQSPFGNRVDLTNVRMSDPWGSYGGNPFPLVLDKNIPFPTYGSTVTHQWDSDAPYMQQWNLNIQRQITTDWLVTANYIGNNTIHYPIGVQLNPAVFMGLNPCTINGINYPVCSTTANTNQRRIHYLKNPSQGQYYSQIGELQNVGTANYHGLLLSSQKRMSNGVSVLANYTWSHCISDPWENSLGGPSIVPGNRKAFHSNCSSGDTRHIFNLSAVLQTPRFSSPRLRWLASDWQLSPIVQTRSSQFFTVTQGVDTALTGVGGQTPNLVGNPYPSDQNVNRWIDRAAFQTPAVGTYGNLGQFNMKGPGVFQFDLALSRTFGIGEGKTVQLRSEAFNILNHANFAPPVSALNSAAFGQIQRAADPRILQFALKFAF